MIARAPVSSNLGAIYISSSNLAPPASSLAAATAGGPGGGGDPPLGSKAGVGDPSYAGTAAPRTCSLGRRLWSRSVCRSARATIMVEGQVVDNLAGLCRFWLPGIQQL
jgi:hypothetical protein